MRRLFERLVESVKSPKYGLELLVRNTICEAISDENYIQFVAKLRFGKKLDLENPITFNEKMNWLKLHDHNPLYTKLADKYAVKSFVTEKIGAEYVVPCYGVWDSFDDIDFNQLPISFVLKCTHDSSGAIVCRDKAKLNISSTKAFVKRSLEKNNFYHSREWVYKDIPHRVIADKLLDDGSGHELRDYKFWCFNGVPTYMYCTNKAADIFENFYDMDFNPVEINHGFRRQIPEFECPKEFDIMKDLAQKLSEGIPFVRIDFFDVDGHVYFGEFTFYDWAGFRPFADEKWDKYLGGLINLKKSLCV